MSLWMYTSPTLVRIHAPVGGCPPRRVGVDGLLSKDLHQVVLRGRTVRKGCGVDTMSIVGYGSAFGHDLEEYHTEFGW